MATTKDTTFVLPRRGLFFLTALLVFLALLVQPAVSPPRKPGSKGRGGGFVGKAPSPRGGGGRGAAAPAAAQPQAAPTVSVVDKSSVVDDQGADEDDVPVVRPPAPGGAVDGDGKKQAAVASKEMEEEEEVDEEEEEVLDGKRPLKAVAAAAGAGGGGDDEAEEDEEGAAVSSEETEKSVAAKYAAVGADRPVVTQIKPGFKRQKGQKRVPTQASAAGGSPNAAAVAVGFIDALPSKDERSEGKGFEWLHCSGWVFGNIDSLDGKVSAETPQQPRNLVLGTRYSNEEMIPYETALQWLANDCGKNVQFTLTTLPTRDGKRPFLADSISWTVSQNVNGNKFVKTPAFSTTLDHRVRVTEKDARQEIFAALFPGDADDAPDGCTADGKAKKRRKARRIGGSKKRKKTPKKKDEGKAPSAAVLSDEEAPSRKRQRTKKQKAKGSDDEIEPENEDL